MDCCQPFRFAVVSSVNLSGVPAVASLLLLISLLLPLCPPVLVSLPLLASPAAPVVSCALVGPSVRPAVNVFLPLLFSFVYGFPPLLLLPSLLLLRSLLILVLPTFLVAVPVVVGIPNIVGFSV
jgi:hypothetical protein